MRDGRVPIFVLAGQSNAVGYGTSWEQLPPLHGQRSDNILLWYSQGDPLRPRISERWVPLLGAEHRSVRSLGAELSSSSYIAEKLKSSVAIVKVAFNGTYLGRSARLDWNVNSNNELFHRLIGEINRSANNMPEHKIGWLAGFFWIQGESDAKSSSEQPAIALAYYQNLKALIESIRRKFDCPFLPVVIARIAVPEVDARGRRFSYRNIIRGAQEALARNDNFIGMISTDDLPKQPDNLHFTSQGQLEMGRKLAEAWLCLAEQSMNCR